MPAGEAFAWPTTDALDRLMAHSWPGNVRELENVLQRALLLRDGGRIEASDLSIETNIATPVRVNEPVELTVVPTVAADETTPHRLADIAKALQARAIADALAATGGHRLRAAERLGISERTLRYRLADMRAAA